MLRTTQSKGLPLAKTRTHRCVLVASCSMLLLACDPNAAPRYGQSGLPENCRAYVQYAIDAWRAGEYSAEDTFAGLERNCGHSGHAWGW